MRSLRALPCLLVLAALGAGDEAPPETLTVALEAGLPDETTRLGFGASRPLLVETTTPRFVMGTPEFQAEDPLFFRVELGETKGIPFFAALDRSEPGRPHDLLYLDRDRDLDLSNDGEPVRARLRTLVASNQRLVEFLDVRVDLPYVQRDAAGDKEKEIAEPYACVFFYVAKAGERPATVQVERDGWREGVVEAKGGKYRLALIDENSDGQYTTGDVWTLRPFDVDRARFLDRDPLRAMVFPAWTADEKWTLEVQSVAPSGRTVTLELKPAQETERAFLMRVATARQSEDERKLGIDPLRPRVADDKNVDWITGKDAAYAIGIGQAASVRKRILLDFSGPRCVWCARMNAYTYKDREVFQLLDRFVCAKIGFVAGNPDAKKYEVTGTPTFVIVGLDGTVLSRHEGFMKPSQFAAWLKRWLQ